MLSYRIQFKTSAAKSLKKIPKADRIRIVEKVDSFTENLPNPDTTKMKGSNPFHKVRVGDYRIIYEIKNNILVILVVKIGHRKDIYKNLS
jgi:mRNA interferase RelE/StbE